MNARHHRTVWLVLALDCFAAAAHAGESQTGPSTGEIRVAVERGLRFLTAGGDQWMEEKSCNACHHMPLLLWSHREARRRGFAVEPGKFDEWLDWSRERAADKKLVPEESALMILALPTNPAPQLAQRILDEQGADGAWNPAGQFASMQRRETAEAQANSMRLLLLALSFQAESAAAGEARTRASSFLAKSAPAQSVETLVFQALWALRSGSQSEAEIIRDQLVKLQHEDGGWSWRIGEPSSDALATGEVLHGLASFTDDRATHAIDRARRWLLSAQGTDGGWRVDITTISKMDRSGPAKSKSFKEASEIYRFWASAWATIGLLHAVPVTAPE